MFREVEIGAGTFLGLLVYSVLIQLLQELRDGEEALGSLERENIFGFQQPAVAVTEFRLWPQAGLFLKF